MFYRDLARAKIPRETRAGVADLHSLRHSFVSAIVSGGANVKTAQELARHSTPKLTFDVYAHARLHDVVGAVERLPDPFQAPPRMEAARATGTDGQPIRKCFDEYLPNGGEGNRGKVMDPDVMAESHSSEEFGVSPSELGNLRPVDGLGWGEKKARPVGFEPTTFGFEVSKACLNGSASVRPGLEMTAVSSVPVRPVETRVVGNTWASPSSPRARSKTPTWE
jgi:hypothetical protein